MNDFNIDITVKQFLNKLFLMAFDWFYCYVDFPKDKYQELGGKYECSSLINWKENRDEKIIDDFMNFWGNFKVNKVQIIPKNGMYITGKELNGMGMVIYVKYEEGMFK